VKPGGVRNGSAFALPEPATMLLLASGLVWFEGVRRELRKG